MEELIVLWPFNIQNWFIFSSIRSWIAYANEANIVNKDSLLLNWIFLLIFLELLGDILAEKPVEIQGTDCIIVVDNVPTIPPDRLEKLKNVIRKVFSKFGRIVTEHYPLDDNGCTKG